MVKAPMAALLTMVVSSACAETFTVDLIGGRCNSNNFYPTLIKPPPHIGNHHLVVIAVPGPGPGAFCFQLSASFPVGSTVEIYNSDPSLPYYERASLLLLDEFATADLTLIQNHRIAAFGGIFVRKLSNVPGGYNWGFVNSVLGQ